MKKLIFIIVLLISVFYFPVTLIGAGRYVPGEMLIKFKKPAANIIEVELAGKQGSDIQLPFSSNSLQKKYKLKDVKVLFAGFKQKSQEVSALLKKDESVLSDKERHILKRQARAPKNAQVPDLSGIYKIQLELESGQLLEEVVEAYNNDTNVEYAELNYIYSVRTVPNDPYFSSQWALNKIEAPQAWNIGTGSSDVIIAVIDTGVDYNHRDLQNNIWTDENGYHGYDFYNKNNDPMDDYGHGTHCAGIIAAEGNNNLDIAGVCWNAKIMAIKCLSSTGSV